jgi:hypothetical protein
MRMCGLLIRTCYTLSHNMALDCFSYKQHFTKQMKQCTFLFYSYHSLETVASFNVWNLIFITKLYTGIELDGWEVITHVSYSEGSGFGSWRLTILTEVFPIFVGKMLLYVGDLNGLSLFCVFLINHFQSSIDSIRVYPVESKSFSKLPENKSLIRLLASDRRDM